MKKSCYILALSAIVLLYGCEKNLSVNTFSVQTPVVSSFSPTEGAIGTMLTVYGSHLTRVDSILIGGGKATLLYRVSDQEVVAQVNQACQSGQVSVYNEAGHGSSATDFTMRYPQPVVETYPTEATVGDQVELTGQRLHLISAVMIDTIRATIVMQQQEKLVFTVPYYDSDDPLILRVAYFDGTQEVLFSPEGATLLVKLVAPQITDCPDQLTKYAPVQITGKYMDLIDTLYIGTLVVNILLKNSTMIEFDVPADYFDGPFTGDLRAVYYKRKSMILKADFQVFADPNELRYHVYKQVTLSGRSANGGSDRPFFDADQGLVISTCEAENNMMDIDFLLYDNTGYAQLYSPSNATSILKNFKCGGTAITASNPAAWSASTFYGINTMSRVLDPAKAAHKAVIDAYEEGTIFQLDNDFFAGISTPTSKGARIYPQDNSASYFSAETYRYGWIRNAKTEKNGIIKILSVETDENTGKTHTVTFDIIWEK